LSHPYTQFGAFGRTAQIGAAGPPSSITGLDGIHPTPWLLG
jgi:hypothetical protein